MPRPERSKKKFPYPYKDQQHEVSHETAIRYRKRARALFGSGCTDCKDDKNAEAGLGASYGYHRDIFDKILKQERCVGIRVYPGIDDEGRFTLLFAGFDADGNNILKGTIGDTPYRCPPFCPTRDGILA